MTTLIAVYNSDGCVGRCDAKCYNAREPECDCICGGKNHGAGLKRALDNTTEMAIATAEDWGLKDKLEQFRTIHNLEGLLEVKVEGRQPGQARLPGF